MDSQNTSNFYLLLHVLCMLGVFPLCADDPDNIDNCQSTLTQLSEEIRQQHKVSREKAAIRRPHHRQIPDTTFLNTLAWKEWIQEFLENSPEGRKYRVSHYIKTGGQGMVWKAENRETGQEVALKFPRHRHLEKPKSDRAEKTDCDLKREYDWLVGFDSVSGEGGVVVKPIELLSIQSQKVLVMKWVDSNNNGLTKGSPSGVLDFFLQAARGLSKGVLLRAGPAPVHRDISESNLVVELHTGQPVFLDAGLSRYEGEEIEGFSGNPKFMSPQRFVDESKVKSSADVFSLNLLFRSSVLRSAGISSTTLLSYRENGTVRYPYEKSGKEKSVSYDISRPKESMIEVYNQEKGASKIVDS